MEKDKKQKTKNKKQKTKKNKNTSPAIFYQTCTECSVITQRVIPTVAFAAVHFAEKSIS